jgi:hypothetical protein
MHIPTTEAQRHRENEEGKDPRTSPIIGAAIEVHRALGPGRLESAYEECLGHELRLRKLEFRRQEKLLPIHEAQPLTRLKLASKRVGLLFNFNVPALTQGIVRRVL